MMIVIAGKFVAITSILNDELESNTNDTTMTEQACAVSSNSMNMVELEQRCFLSCDEVHDSL